METPGAFSLPASNVRQVFFQNFLEIFGAGVGSVNNKLSVNLKLGLGLRMVGELKTWGWDKNCVAVLLGW